MPATDFPDIHYKSNSGPINFDTAKGIVECFVAGIGNKDSVGDVCVSGAFTKSLQRRKPRVVWGHVWNEPIGKVLEIYEVPANDARLPAKMRVAGVGGLYAKVQFNLGSERGREAFANVAFFGEEQEWSIGYKTLRSQQDPVLQANMLYEVELYEVSPVLHGANQMTATISVKDDQTAIEIGHADCPDGACDLAKDESSAPVEEKHIPVQDNTFDAVAIKIGNELSARSGSIINVISLEKAAVVFTRMAANGDVVTYRCGYHFDGLTFMFARPERTTPGINVPAVTPVIPSVSPQLPPVPVRPQMPLAPVVAPVVVVAPVQVNRVALSVPTVVKPGPMGMETVVLPQIRYENTPKPIDIAAAIERVRKRNGYKSLFDFGEVTETDFLDSVVTGNNPTSISYIIPVAIKDAYAVKSLVDPILDYYRIEARVEPEGIVLSSGVTKDFADAVSLATKGLGRTIGRALSAVRPNIGAGRVGSPNLRGERKRGRGFNFGMPEGDTNPMTREDGNRDGTVFDGIPGWEQPDPTPGGAGSIDNREASAAQEAIAATSGKPDSGAIKKDEKKKPKLSSTTDPERKPRGNNLSREFGDMTEEEHSLYGRYDEGGRERRDAATGRTARDDNAADKKRGQRDSAARSARLRQAEAAGDRGDRDDDEASRIKLSSGKTDRRHADRSAEMEQTFPNSEENKKRLAHDATADTWRKDGFGWTEIPRYSGDKNRSPDYLRGREIGFNQGRLMWDGTDGHRTRPEKFNEKQKSSIQYADWYENLLNSVSRFVDAHKGGDDVDEWNGVEAGFKEVVITNAPDTSTWPSDRVKRLGDLMDRYDPSLRGKNPKSTGKLSSAHNAAGFNAGMEFIARIGAGREFNRENKKKKKNTARRANYPSTQPRLSSGAGKEIDAPEEEADRPPSGNIGSDYRRFDLETTDGGPNLLDGMHDEISRSPKLRSKIMGEIASMLGAAGLTEKNGYDTSRAFDVLTGSEKDFEDHIDALSDARAALGSGSYGMLKARLKEYESSAEHIKAQDAADGRLLRLEQNAKAIRERLTAIDRAKTLSAQRDDDAMNSADIGQLVLGKEENALWDARNDLANKYNVDKPEKLSSGKADKVADTLENHGDWEKTDDGIEIYPQGKDVAYQIGNVGKGKWAVTRHWDFERNAGQDAKEYEHDKIFASVSAAKKWADADFRRGENSEKPLPAAKRKKTSKSSSGKKNSKMINGVKIDVSPGAELDGADLDGANLKGANLKGAYLRRTDMGGADLSGANLVGADMTEAKLVNANLSDADLSDADLGGADLYFANLEGANLNGANLIGAKFTRAKLINANLTDTQMNGADLVDADLTGADLEGANLRKAKLGGTNLTGANLIGATMPDNTKWTPDTDMTKWTGAKKLSSGKTPKFKDDPLSPFKDLPEDSIVTLEGDKYRIYPGDRLSSGFTYGAETGIKTKDEMFEFLNAQLIDAIEKADPTSWKMPWRVTSMPNNPTTKKTYTGTNYMALSIIGSERGYASTQWAGYGQWEKVGGQVRKGAKGVPILVPIMFKPKDKDGAADPALGDKVKRGGMAWKVIRVFNRDEVDGLPDDYGVVVKLDEGTRVENLEKTLSEIAPTINHGGARAFYRPSDDAITVPAFADFKTARGYYGTVAHELMHWTGGEKRLKRANMNQFGSPEYAYEELIAEIASSMFLAAHGVEPDIQDNHAPYLASWLKALRSDPTALRRAMKQAQDAFNYAMGLSPSMTRLFKSEDEGGLEADTPDVAEIVTPDLGSGDKLSSGGRPRRRIVSLEDLPEYKFPTDKYEASPQQKTISNAVATGADVVVRALAGTGKTSTLGDIARRLLGEEPSTKTNDPPTKTGDLPVKMGATGMLTQKQKYTIKPGRIEIENGFLVKDRIKEAGGKWDGANKKWFVPLSDDSDEREVLKKLQNLTNRLATGGPSAETRIIYLAFNKSAELSAKGAMPSNTEVRTGDALAWAFVRNVNEKLLAKKEKGMRNLKGIAGYLGVKGILIERKGGGEKKELTQEDIVRALSHAVKHYSISEDDEISAKHFAPIQRKASGKVDGVNWDEFELPEVLVKFAQKYWNDLNDPDGKIYADFTHWTKMWALSRPDFSEEIPNSKNGFGSGVDIVFFDEAQDINPVMARVIREQTIQKVYVGDSNQAIYGFRGATDTLSEVKATYDLPLTESWRFNQAIADFANKFLVIANETELRVIGRGKGGKIVYDMQDADVIEVRTRGGALDAIRSELAKGRTVGVSKNFKTKLTTFILHAEHLVLKRSGKPEKQSDDLVGYESWKEVLDAVEKGDEPQLATLVAIVLEQGEGVDGINKLKDLLGRVREIGSAGPSDDPIDVEITTAHTSKGGEWPKVKIWKDFWGPRKNKVTGAITMPTQEEYRIAYVALTRPTSELDPGSLKWILEYVPDGDDRLSSGRRAARRAGAADKLSSGKKKKPSANARRRPASAEERQLFADGRRNRAQTIQGKKKPGPSTDEFTDGDTFSSGRAARLNRRLSSGGFNSTENDTAPAQRPWFIPEGLTGDSIGSIGKSDINPDRQTDFIGKLSDNDGYDGNADTPWYLDAKKFRDLLRDSTVDGDGKRIPGEPWSDAKVMELLNISEKNVRRLSEPGVGIKSSMVEHVMETVGDKNLHGYEMQERLEATWGFNAYPYWYDIDDEALSKKEYDRLVDRNRRGEVRTGSGYKPGDLEAPVALPDRAERPAPKVVTAEAAITSKKLPMERLYEFLELSPDDTMEEKEKKTGLRKADINNYVKNGLNPAVLRGLIARGTIPNAQTLFGEVGKTFDMQAPQPYLFLRIEDFLREKGHKVAGTPNLDFIVGEKNIAALIKKLRAKPDPLAVDARTKHYSPDELGAVVGRINEKFATDYVPDEIFPRDENGIPKKLSSGRASTSGSRRVFGSSSRGNRLGSGATVEARNLTGARGFELNRRINAIDDRIKKAGLSRGLATQARARAAKQNKLASGAKPATNITPKMQNELISWAKNGGKWSNFAKTMLAAFEENGKLSPGQWTRLMQIHDSTVKRR